MQEQYPVIILLVLAIVVLIISVAFLNKLRQAGQVDSFETEFLSQPAPFPCSNSVYSSLPPEYDYDRSWQYLSKYDSTCLANTENGCKRGQEFNCYINPHNQRYCFWK